MDPRIEQAVGSLEAILKEQLRLHEQLESVVDRQRDALREADTEKLSAVCRLQNEKVQAIGELEKQRLESVAAITLMLRPDASEPMRMSELTGHLPAPLADKLNLLRTSLRQRMTEVRQRCATARRATESLVRHVHGLVRTVGSMQAGSGTYGGRGAKVQGAVAVSTFSLTA